MNTAVPEKAQTVMIDTLKVRIPCRHRGPIYKSVLRKVDQDGAVLHNTYLPDFVPGISSCLRIRSCHFVHPQTNEIRQGLEVEGSVPKFLQGHNLFGGSSVRTLTIAVLAALKQIWPAIILPDDNDFDDLEWGNFWLLRVDLARMYKLPPAVMPAAWIDAAEFGIRHRRKLPVRKGDTLYVRPESQRSAVKFYGKEQEFRADESLGFITTQHKELLTEYARNTIRTEGTMRSPELKARGLAWARNWRTKTADRELDRLLSGLCYQGEVQSTSAVEEQLSNAELRIFHVWQGGCRVRSTMSPGTFIKHQKRFASLGIDLALRPGVRTSPVNIADLLTFPALGIAAFARHEPRLLLGARPERKAGDVIEAGSRMHIYTPPDRAWRDGKGCCKNVTTAALATL